jgi:hypothetical protein
VCALATTLYGYFNTVLRSGRFRSVFFHLNYVSVSALTVVKEQGSEQIQRAAGNIIPLRMHSCESEFQACLPANNRRA